MQRADGQGTVEYVAVVLLVAVLLLGALSLSGAAGVANAVGTAVARALCMVRGHGCATLAPSPCVVRRTTLKASVNMRVLLVRIGRDTAIVRSERSDGTIEVTLLDDLSAGASAMLGTHGRVEVGTLSVGTGATAEAQLVALLGGGRTWRLRSAREADRLVHRLEVVVAARGAAGLPGIGPLIDVGGRILHRGAHARLPEPDSRTVTTGLRGEAGVLLGPLTGGRAGTGGVVGRVRARDGTATWLLRVRGDASLPLLAAIGLRGRADGELSLALAVDVHGRPTRLTVGASGGVAEGSPLARIGPVGGRHGRSGRVQASVALDLGEPGDRALVDDVLRALAPSHVRALPGAVGALADALADHGAVRSRPTATRTPRSASTSGPGSGWPAGWGRRSGGRGRG